MSIGIYIATNRLVDLPLPAGYHVMVLGSQHAMPRPKEQLRIGEADVLFETDGENIVEKNPFFCELTGLYWLLKNRWKEMEDYVGFCQYRRYFAFHPQRGGQGRAAAEDFPSLIRLDGVEARLREADFHVLTPERFAPRTVMEMYQRYHRASDLAMLRRILSERYPDYLPAFDEVMQRQEMHGRNMFLTSRYHFLSYAEWLLDVLLRLEKRIAIPYEDKYQRRLFGFLAERMCDVYLQRHHLTSSTLSLVQLDLDKAVPRDYDRQIAQGGAQRTLRLWRFLRGRRLTAAGRESDMPRLSRLLPLREGDRFISLYRDGRLYLSALLEDMKQQAQQGAGRTAYLFFTPHYQEIRPHLLQVGCREGVDFMDGMWLTEH